MIKFSCHVSAGEYARTVFSIFFAENWFWFLFPLIFFALLSVFDVRFLIVALMVLFIIIPMIGALLYINYLLTLETRWSIVEKELLVGDEGLTLRFAPGNMKDAHIEWRQLKGMFSKGGLLVFPLRMRRYQYLVIPLKSIEEQGVRKDFLEFCACKMG